MPFQSQWHTFLNTDRTCVKSLSRRCLEQHWGFANYIVTFPMRNPDSASYSIVRLRMRVRSFHRDQSQCPTQCFQLSSTVFAPERQHVLSNTCTPVLTGVFDLRCWADPSCFKIFHNLCKVNHANVVKIQFITTTLKCTEP